MILNKVNKPVITGSGAITVAPDLHHSTPEKQKAAGPTARARVAGLEFWAAAARSSGHVSNKKQAVTSKSGDIEPFINPYNGPDILINKALFYKFCSNQKSIVSRGKNEETLVTMHSLKASWRVFPEEVTPNLCWAVHRVERATDEFLGPWTSKQDKTGILATTIGIGQTPVDVSPTTTRLTSDEKTGHPKDWKCFVNFLHQIQGLLLVKQDESSMCGCRIVSISSVTPLSSTKWLPWNRQFNLGKKNY